MIRVVLIGGGNVAFHLQKALHRAPGISLRQVVSRRLESLSDFESGVPRAILGAPLERADIYLLAVADQAIAPVSALLRDKDGLVVHTSGATGLEALEGLRRRGVFYPLQTFSRKRALDMAAIPLCIETEHPKDLSLLRSLAAALSRTVVELPLDKRRHLHLAAVFVNNFSNHMVHLGQAHCRQQGLEESLLRPLLEETCDKLGCMPAYDAQTGPARRNDRATEEAHRKLIENPLLRELYERISESIQETYD